MGSNKILRAFSFQWFIACKGKLKQLGVLWTPAISPCVTLAMLLCLINCHFIIFFLPSVVLLLFFIIIIVIFITPISQPCGSAR